LPGWTRSEALIVFTVFVTGCSHIGTKPGTASIDRVLRDAVEQKKVPGVVAMVATAGGIIYQGAAGKRDVHGNAPMTADSIFRIASMTKPVVSVAVMQLVERGNVKLDEPAASYLPELSRVQVLENGRLRRPKRSPTVRQLLSHTAGFGYEFTNRELHDYVATGAVPSMFQGGEGFLKAPLLFDPGARWEYGINTDWLGKLVEAASGRSLEEYCHQHIFEPLGMTDSFFNVPNEKQSRLVTVHQRKEDGSLAETPPQPLKPAQFFSGGGGLHSTVGDYLKFTMMLLGRRDLARTPILKSETLMSMGQNQIGDLMLREIPSLSPQTIKDGIRLPGSLDKFGLGFALNSKAVEGGRSAGSMAWAGVYNTFFWIDRTQMVCAVIMMQMLPFLDDAPKAVFEDFERAVYASLSKTK
jgi:methyl acetate hydrolase